MSGLKWYLHVNLLTGRTNSSADGTYIRLSKPALRMLKQWNTKDVEPFPTTFVCYLENDIKTNVRC